MAQRIYNEYTSDSKRKANFEHGGVKMGNFGTGGRVYTKRFTRPHGAGPCSGCNTMLLAGVVTLLGMSGMFYNERSMYQTLGCVEEAAENALILGTNVQYNSFNDEKLVFVQGNNPVVSGSAPYDPMFGLTGTSTMSGVHVAKLSAAQDSVGGDMGALRRETEYCQWTEIRHSQCIKVGQEPDYCASSSSTAESCEGVSCYGRSVYSCGGECCSVEPGDDIMEEEVWYTYYKSWTPQRISSLFFDNPAAYHNPQRDPAPSSTFYSGDISLSGIASSSSSDFLHVRAEDFEPALSPWSPLYLPKTAALDVTERALQLGFNEADHAHYYSRVPKDGIENPILKAAASYLVDGIIDVNSIASATGVESLLSKAGLDWITKGTCNAGDIRVHFEAKFLPDSVTVLGMQRGGSIVPNAYSTGISRIILAPGILSITELLEKFVSDGRWWCNVYRAGIVVMYLFSLFLIRNESIRLFMGAICSIILSFVGTWFIYYGLDDVVIPGVLGVVVFSVSLMFKMSATPVRQSKQKQV